VGVEAPGQVPQVKDAPPRPGSSFSEDHTVAGPSDCDQGRGAHRGGHVEPMSTGATHSRCHRASTMSCPSAVCARRVWAAARCSCGPGIPDVAHTRRPLGLVRALGEPYDLVLIDIMLPGDERPRSVAAASARHDVPISMLTARGEEGNSIRALEAGADDHVLKPCRRRVAGAHPRRIFTLPE